MVAATRDWRKSCQVGRAKCSQSLRYPTSYCGRKGAAEQGSVTRRCWACRPVYALRSIQRSELVFPDLRLGCDRCRRVQLVDASASLDGARLPCLPHRPCPRLLPRPLFARVAGQRGQCSARSILHLLTPSQPSREIYLRTNFLLSICFVPGLSQQKEREHRRYFFPPQGNLPQDVCRMDELIPSGNHKHALHPLDQYYLAHPIDLGDPRRCPQWPTRALLPRCRLHTR